MDLKEFVRESLSQIVAGVSEAQKELKGTGALINPRWGDSSYEVVSVEHRMLGNKLVQDVEFDVAVMASEGTETKGAIGVVVAGIGLGAGGKASDRSEYANRLRFAVPVALPQAEEDT